MSSSPLRMAHVVSDVPADLTQRRGELVSDGDAAEIGRFVNPPQRGARDPAWFACRVLFALAHDGGDERRKSPVGLPPVAPPGQIAPDHRVITGAALVGELPHRGEEGLAYGDSRFYQ